ncbi:50S ribosomal protein L21 [Candidatus Gottesmanbacteria bacterium CG11_big_fil_rev_8_21_14_0_20_37_11]|uniref:Large ribosomal subunit protein bL21 n=3 Tax=Candidatus Gottesmaniibacteriota TaxID=1752720 RepID=A0A2M7RT68_9BACT|nr:MAG: 50S ribosomal protein L21 [Candidatus Gottesmanbacteria bacterium CG1_02_37_22]PIP32163.1 MAG: 50S ribosomal protein L21 [Candidatus Gottesmanbacteria bacterium CG23_combo_of_CG06-09_8_20_14_all_37_19]PIR08767.1 MAG: 50S ribosomal protein L21 [Candidatus Gottesmanbacteria bacterium CG11_big_fil_rev_8_21_14_0_20_37_11]PIZ03285.1 MAG: 50S ribosomal protein L21 [Candidatus Gottesmanbacteria bacterium CG_4_10_14_0_8_um_filter_37_24]
MKYAIVKIGGKQFKAEEGKEILVDKLVLKADDKYEFKEILLIRTDDNIYIGDPYVKNGYVTGKYLGDSLGDKIFIEKFKAKVRYRRRIGFRASYSRIIIERIEVEEKTKISRKK